MEMGQIFSCVFGPVHVFSCVVLENGKNFTLVVPLKKKIPHFWAIPLLVKWWGPDF